MKLFSIISQSTYDIDWQSTNDVSFIIKIHSIKTYNKQTKTTQKTKRNTNNSMIICNKQISKKTTNNNDHCHKNESSWGSIDNNRFTSFQTQIMHHLFNKLTISHYYNQINIYNINYLCMLISYSLGYTHFQYYLIGLFANTITYNLLVYLFVFSWFPAIVHWYHNHIMTFY